MAQIENPDGGKPAAAGQAGEEANVGLVINGDGGQGRRAVGQVRWWAVGVLGALLAAALVLLWVTRDAMGHLSFLHARSDAAQVLGQGEQKTLVDLRPWQTAEALAPLAVTSEEVEDAGQAEALADHDADQAFAAALRRAGMERPRLTPEATELAAKVAGLRETVRDDTAALRDLLRSAQGGGSGVGARGSAQAAGVGGGAGVKAAGVQGGGEGTVAAGAMDASGARASGAVGGAKADEDARDVGGEFAPGPGDSDDVAIAKAQWKLDTDELNDAQQDLQRAAGDDRTRIQQELAAHEASMKEYDAHPHDLGQTAVITANQYGTLAGQAGAWWRQRTRYGLIEEARRDAQDRAVTLAAEHKAMEASATAAAGGMRGAGGGAGGGEGTRARLAGMQRMSEQRQMMSIYDDRIATEQQLAAVYAKWGAQVQVQRRIVVHLMLRSLAWIVLIVLGVVLADWLISFWTRRRGLDRRRSNTMRRLIQLVLWLVGGVFILLVVFGAPQQTPTVIGLVTAGLTVAMQDFIIAFLGWFVLMSKNGIRVGDAVEINAVAGEVIDIGLFRTTLLETGNWTDRGHPTGRRVSFLNGFAIRGQYFNFTTAGQWMWDEMTVSVPASEDTYGMIERIHKAVLELTAADAKLAEEEWGRAAKLRGLGQFSAQPAVDLRPAASGMDIKVRYVTRAADRVGKRNELYERVVEVLQGKAAKVS